MTYISDQAIQWKLIAGALDILIPILVLVVWKVKKKGSILPALAGAGIFVVFAMVLEGIPKAIFFGGTTALSRYVWEHPAVYTLIGCLQAGIFEEVGRFAAFRFLLKKYEKREDAITYGIGHGGIESILVLGFGAISSVGMASMVNSGTLDQVLAGLNEVQAQSVQMQIATLAGYGAGSMALEVLERIFAMTLHIALSVVVFRAIREKKIDYLFVAIVLHAIFDVPAALCQCGVLGIAVCELLLLVMGAACGCFAAKMYAAMKE